MKKEELEKLRHSTSHVLAAAIKALYPKVKLGIGPAIEEGFYYDFDNLSINPSDLEKIEKKMQEIINKTLPFKKLLLSKKEAEKTLKDEPYKLELLKGLKDEKISFYQTGDFIDLCIGPHIKNTSEIKVFKLLNIAGAYWRGDERNPMLQRIYGTAFSSENELTDYLKIRIEAEKRDHRKLGKELDLFSFHPEGPGFVFWHPKGWTIYQEILKLWRQEHRKAGYLEVNTPIILDRKLWEESGHWNLYRENMYTTKIDNRDFAIKPMNCPGGILIYRQKLHSYKEFPLRIAELGLVHRHELSGVLAGLFRVRQFTQDDAHIYCTEEQLESELIRAIELSQNILKKFGFTDYAVEISLRSEAKKEKYLGTDDIWKKAETALANALKKKKLSYKTKEGEAKFYGPSIDIKIKDCLGREWQCTTIQLDFNLPKRFRLNYLDKDDIRKEPIMIHRTILGSLERFIGILIEHYAGKFPLWLAPVQVKLLTLTDRNKRYAEKVKEELELNDIRVELDDRAESIGKKIRESQLKRINYMVTLGDKEEKNKTVAIRTLDGKVKFDVKVDKFIEDLLKEIKIKNVKS